MAGQDIQKATSRIQKPKLKRQKLHEKHYLIITNGLEVC